MGIIQLPPTDTIFEREPLDPPLDSKTLIFYKLLMLQLANANKIENMTPTETIDAMESCRRKGLLKIYQNDKGEFSAQLTPTGATKAFLERLKNG